MHFATTSLILGQSEQSFSSKCSINSLPHELLVEIIDYVTFAPPFSEGLHYQSLFTMTAVSRQFRSTLHSAPLLWARAVDFKAPVKCIQELLRLSGNSLPFHGPGMPHFHCGMSSESNEVEVWRMMIAQPQILHRCLSLRVDVADCTWSSVLLPILCDIGAEDLPALKIHFNQCLKPQHNTLQAPRASLFKENKVHEHLQSLSLIDGSFVLQHSSFPNLGHLSIALQFEDVHHQRRSSLMTPKEWVSFLNSLPQLRSLRLVGAIGLAVDEDGELPSKAVAQVYLPRLKCLNVEDRQSRIGPLLRNVRVPSSCHIQITTRVSSDDLSDSSTTNSAISGLMVFFKNHYSGEDAANFGSKLCVYAGTVGSNRSRRTDLTMTNHGRGQTDILSRQEEQQGPAEGVPRFHLTVIANLSESDVFHPYHTVFTAMHQRLATDGLMVPFSLVETVCYSSLDNNFAESSAQSGFFRALSNTRRLDVRGATTLWSLQNMQTSHDVKYGLFPQLEVIRATGVDFTKKKNEVVYMKTPGMEDIVDFDAFQLAVKSDSLAHVRRFLKTRMERSLEYVPQILSVEVIRGTGACDLRMMLADVKLYGGEIEVVEVGL